MKAPACTDWCTEHRAVRDRHETSDRCARTIAAGVDLAGNPVAVELWQYVDGSGDVERGITVHAADHLDPANALTLAAALSDAGALARTTGNGRP